MDDVVYTLAEWRVKPGDEAEFIEAWKQLDATFKSLPNPPSGTGVLLQSTADPKLFYSFGPWRTPDDVAAMRADLRAQQGISKLRDLCEVATPGAFRVVAQSA